MASTPISELENSSKIYSNDLFVVSQNNADTYYYEQSRNISYSILSAQIWNNVNAEFKDIKYTNLVKEKEDLELGQTTWATSGRVGKQLLNEIESLWDSVNEIKDTLIPIGTMMPFFGLSSEIPSGWLMCDGRFVLYSQYKRLYEVIKYNLGNEDWEPLEQQFRIPNLMNRYVQGNDHAMEYLEEGLPIPIEKLDVDASIGDYTTKGFYNTYTGDWCGDGTAHSHDVGGGRATHTHDITVNVTIPGYQKPYGVTTSGETNSVRPKTCTVIWIIKAL